MHFFLIILGNTYKVTSLRCKFFSFIFCDVGILLWANVKIDDNASLVHALLSQLCAAIRSIDLPVID